MRAISGVLVPKDDRRSNGTRTVWFNNLDEDESDLDAEIQKKTRAYEEGDTGDRRFSGTPAHIVHIREAITEDRDLSRTYASVTQEYDWMEINSSCTEDKLQIDWIAHDPGSEVREIGFIVIGL